MSIKKILGRLKQRIIDIDIGKVKDKIIDVDFGRVKDKIIEINHVLSRILRKIIEVDHEALVFLTVVCVVTGSLVGFGICTVRRGERKSGPSGDLNAMIQELQTELASVREILADRDSEIETLNSSLANMREDKPLIITSVDWNLSNDYLIVQVKNLSEADIIWYTIGVKRVEPESDWYSEIIPINKNLVISGSEREFDMTHWWTEENTDAPGGFLAPDAQYRIAITYTGGYDEILSTSPEAEVETA